MPVVYFKRHKMQLDLNKFDRADGSGESVVRFIPWSEKTLGQHALAKWDSFRLEIDANVFPCLGSRDGCRQLMRDIALRDNFVPEATWLAVADLDGQLGLLAQSGEDTLSGLFDYASTERGRILADLPALSG